MNKGDATNETNTYIFSPDCYINYTVHIKYVNYVNSNGICVTVAGRIPVYLQFA